MKAASLLCLLTSVLAIPTFLAAQSVQEDEDQRGSAKMVIVPQADAIGGDFRPLYAARPNGPNLRVLDGNPDIGSSLTIFRYSRNYTNSSGLHYHTHGYHLWMVEGALKHWDETGSEETAETLLPGSYLYQPADLLHAANCVTERCTAYVMFEGPIETGLPTGLRP